METWTQVAASQRLAANSLGQAGAVRPSISRAYYAVYSLVIARLEKQGQLSLRASGRRNPGHAEVPHLIKATLTGLSKADRRRLSTLFRQLRGARESADYRPEHVVDVPLRREVVRSMEEAWRILEVRPW